MQKRLALPITVGTAKFPGIKIHDTRMIRTARQIPDALRTAFQISVAHYGLNQLRYDLRRMKGAWAGRTGRQTIR